MLGMQMRRAGRAASCSPPQLGQRSSSASAQGEQKVHSKLQMKAPGRSAGRSAPHFSQSGRISSIGCLLDRGADRIDHRFDLAGIVALGHDPDHRFGARGADHQAALAGELGFG
jgi:hypothetical protein